MDTKRARVFHNALLCWWLGGGWGPPPRPPVGAPFFLLLRFPPWERYFSTMFTKRQKLTLEAHQTALDRVSDDIRRTRDDLFTIQEQMKAWEIRMEEMHDKTVYAIKRHEKRFRDAPVANGLPEPKPADPTTERVLQRRRMKGNGISTEQPG